MTTLRKAMPFTLLILCAALTCLPLAAQNNPDCSFTFPFTGDDGTQAANTHSNLSGNTPCVNWRVTFSTTGTLTTTVTFQTSPDNLNWTAVPNTICSAGTQPPCVIQGSNPVSGTQGQMYVSAYGSYVRIVTSGSSGTGTGTARAYGAKGASASAGGGVGGNSGNLWALSGNTLSPSIAGNNVAVGNTVLGPKTIGAGANQLPAAATCTRCMTMVTDAASASDCTVGSGSSIAVCYSNGTLWGPLGAGATPAPTPSTTITLTAPRGYAICTGTCTVTLPVPAAGYEFCVMNDDAVATAITLAALGSGAMYENAIRTAYGTPGTGTMVLAAAQGNAVCLVGRDVTHYLTVSYTGSPTVN